MNAARREAALIVQKAEQAAQTEREHALQVARTEAEQDYERQVRGMRDQFAQALLQEQAGARRKILERQNEVLSAVFDRLRQRFLQLPPPRYAAIMSRLLQEAAAGRGGLLRIHPQDRPLFDDVLGQLAGEARLQVAVDTEQPLEQPGGFIFIGELYEVDYTLDTLMDVLRREWSPRVAAKLFGPGEAAT